MPARRPAPKSTKLDAGHKDDYAAMLRAGEISARTLLRKAAAAHALVEFAEEQSGKGLDALLKQMVDSLQPCPDALAASEDDLGLHFGEDSDIDNDRDAGPEGQGQPSQARPRPCKPDAEAIIRNCALMTSAILDKHGGRVARRLRDVVRFLHDRILNVFVDCKAAQDAVAQLCADYWRSNAPDKAALTKLVPFYVFRALSGVAADVKRCWAISGALSDVVFGTRETEELSDQLLRLPSRPHVLNCVEGSRLISHLLTLHPSLVEGLTDAMWNQSLVGNPRLLDTYGEVIFRGWNQVRLQTEPGMRDCIEQQCIQVFMKRAILAHSPAEHANLRCILEPLHANKKVTDAMLHRLYQPLLWRHLNAANPLVRCYALHLMLDAFPIQEPSMEKEAMEEQLNMQLTHVFKAMRDPAVNVRTAATLGAAKLVAAWWHLLSAQTVTKLMVLLQENAFDAAAVSVRHAVLVGAAQIADNVKAEAVLRVLLPKVTPLLYDPSVKVRTAMANLMKLVSTHEGLRELVPTEELVRVLGADKPSVVAAIQDMLLPNIVGAPATSTTQPCAKLLELLRENSAAGSVVCAHLGRDAAACRPSGGAAREQACEIAAHLCEHLLSCEMVLGTGRCKAAKSTEIEEGGGEDGDGTEDEGPGGENVSPNRARRGNAKGGGPARKCRPDKRSAAAAAAEGHRPESPEEWTSILYGWQHLVSAARVCWSASGAGSTTKARKKGKGGGKGKRNQKAGKGKGTGQEGVDAEGQEALRALVEALVPGECLEELFEKAPTVQAARAVLEVAQAVCGTQAAQPLATRCLGFVDSLVVTLPGLHRQGQRSLKVYIHAISRKGRLPARQAELSDLVCDVLDFLLLHCPEALLASLAASLAADCEDVPEPPSRGRRRRPPPGPRLESSLPSRALGALAATAMLVRHPDKSVQLKSLPGLDALVRGSKAVVQALLDAPAASSATWNSDVMLASHVHGQLEAALSGGAAVEGRESEAALRHCEAMVQDLLSPLVAELQRAQQTDDELVAAVMDTAWLLHSHATEADESNPTDPPPRRGSDADAARSRSTQGNGTAQGDAEAAAGTGTRPAKRKKAAAVRDWRHAGRRGAVLFAAVSQLHGAAVMTNVVLDVLEQDGAFPGAELWAEVEKCSASVLVGCAACLRALLVLCVAVIGSEEEDYGAVCMAAEKDVSCGVVMALQAVCRAALFQFHILHDLDSLFMLLGLCQLVFAQLHAVPAAAPRRRVQQHMTSEVAPTALQLVCTVVANRLSGPLLPTASDQGPSDGGPDGAPDNGDSALTPVPARLRSPTAASGCATPTTQQARLSELCESLCTPQAGQEVPALGKQAGLLFWYSLSHAGRCLCESGCRDPLPASAAWVLRAIKDQPAKIAECAIAMTLKQLERWREGGDQSGDRSQGHYVQQALPAFSMALQTLQGQL